MERFHYFFGGIFCQWHPQGMWIDNVYYNCAEQYMMAQKALQFGDKTSWRSIMQTSSPARQKSLGRDVLGFDEERWKRLRVQIVTIGSWTKYQYDVPRAALLATAGKTLVEASPTDQIWGIGLSAGDIRIEQRQTWRGMNLLGEILTMVREEIMARAERRPSRYNPTEELRDAQRFMPKS